MVRTRGRDAFVPKHGNVQRGVSTLIHGHLAIELGKISYSILPAGATSLADDQQSLPHPSILSSSFPHHHPLFLYTLFIE